jgi:CheY-like chemotaxis protein
VVLAVDDEALVRTILADLLTEIGYNVLEAEYADQPCSVTVSPRGPEHLEPGGSKWVSRLHDQ